MYDTDFFKYIPKNEPRNLLDILGDSSLPDNGDHTEFFGFNLLRFDKLEPKLTKLAEETDFVGFSPRWMIPTRFRNSTNTNLSSTCILIILDS